MITATVVKGGWYWQGRLWSVGDSILASAEQIAAWRESGYVDSDLPAPVPATPARAETADAPRTAREWPHKMSPERYLSRYPSGVDAELARAIIGAE